MGRDEIQRLMMSDAEQTRIRYFADPESVYAWCRDQGTAFVRQNFGNRLQSLEEDDSKREIVFEVVQGPGLIRLRYLVEDAGSVDDRPVTAVVVEASLTNTSKFRRPSSFKVGSDISEAKWGLWNRCGERFEAVKE